MHIILCNCFIKVETRGSGGAKNVLTAKEIEEADCIIVAADAQVPMDRFDGKKVIVFIRLINDFHKLLRRRCIPQAFCKFPVH